MKHKRFLRSLCFLPKKKVWKDRGNPVLNYRRKFLCVYKMWLNQSRPPLQWQSERHECVPVPRDIHLSQVELPLDLSAPLLVAIKHHEPLKKRSWKHTENGGMDGHTSFCSLNRCERAKRCGKFPSFFYMPFFPFVLWVCVLTSKNLFHLFSQKVVNLPFSLEK